MKELIEIYKIRIQELQKQYDEDYENDYSESLDAYDSAIDTYKLVIQDLKAILNG